MADVPDAGLSLTPRSGRCQGWRFPGWRFPLEISTTETTDYTDMILQGRSGLRPAW